MSTRNFNFQNHTLKAHHIHGQVWFESPDIAKALGYSNKRSVTGIYANYKNEFTNGTTKVLDSSTLGKERNKTRLFSLRGVHLIAMLSRTPVAEDFRKWVLDLIERQEGGKSQVKQSSIVIAPNRECLPKMVYHHQSKYNPYRAYVTAKGKSVYVGCYPTVEKAVAAQKSYFEVGEVKRIQTPNLTDGSQIAPDDMVNHFAVFLEAAQLLSCYKSGKDLAWELVAFTQEAALAGKR